MAGILLVNPRRRKRRKMSALQRKYFGKKRRRRARASAPRRRRRRNPVAALNPRRRRRRSYSVARRSRRRRNPTVRGFVNQLQPMVKNGIVGAAGALGLDVLLGFLQPKLPAQLQSGYGLTAAKVLGAIGVGMIANIAGLRGRGNALALGAMTVVLHDELKKLAQAQFPGLALGEYVSFAPEVGYDNTGLLPHSPVGEYVGEYMSDTDDAYAYN